MTTKEAILKLRQDKFACGIPFMINDNSLPTNQAYFEYSDGQMTVVMVGQMNSFEIKRTLSAKEADMVRNRNGLE